MRGFQRRSRATLASDNMKAMINIVWLVMGILMVPLTSVAAPYSPNDEIRTKGEWKLVTIVLNKGTRSQKIIGKIEYGGKEVVGEKDHLLATPLGRYVWRADYESGYATGWITLDADMDIKELIPVEVDLSREGVQLFTKRSRSQPLPGN